MVLQPTIRTAIDFLFQQVELQHGEVLVRRALGYLTAGNVWPGTNPPLSCWNLVITHCVRLYVIESGTKITLRHEHLR